jgi:nucleoside-diphosphate-sugar epimerase
MTEKTTNPKRVLVTGSTGAIGQPVCRRLLERGHYVRGLARRPTPGLEDYVIGDLSDRDKVRAAVEGMDTVLHLGASREFGVKRLILASTLQVVTGHGWPERAIRVEEGPAPVNHYALTKVWAEAIGDMYARVHGLSVISARIGWLPRNPTEAERLVASRIGKDVFFSHDDAERYFERCVESLTPGPAESVILFAASRPLHQPRLDLEPARRIIGYEPQDTWPEGLPFAID